MNNVVSLAEYRTNSETKSSQVSEGMALLLERAEVERLEAASERKAMALIQWKMRFIEYANRHGM